MEKIVLFLSLLIAIAHATISTELQILACHNLNAVGNYDSTHKGIHQIVSSEQVSLQSKQSFAAITLQAAAESAILRQIDGGLVVVFNLSNDDKDDGVKVLFPENIKPYNLSMPYLPKNTDAESISLKPENFFLLLIPTWSTVDSGWTKSASHLYGILSTIDPKSPATIKDSFLSSIGYEASKDQFAIVLGKVQSPMQHNHHVITTDPSYMVQAQKAYSFSEFHAVRYSEPLVLIHSSPTDSDPSAFLYAGCPNGDTIEINLDRQHGRLQIMHTGLAYALVLQKSTKTLIYPGQDILDIYSDNTDQFIPYIVECREGATININGSDMVVLVLGLKKNKLLHPKLVLNALVEEDGSVEWCAKKLEAKFDDPKVSFLLFNIVSTSNK